MAIYIPFFTDAHSLGSLYALMALGLVIVYGILKLVNFAYGELIMVSGYTLFLLGGTSFPWLAMADIAIIMAVITGIATEYVAFRPVRSKSVTAVLITSFAFSTRLQNAALLFISSRARTVPLPEIFSDTIDLGVAIIPMRNILTIAVTVVMLALCTFIMRKTVLGGFLLAMIVTTFNYFSPPDLLKFRDAFTFSLVILILLWRPVGMIKGPATGQRT